MRGNTVSIKGNITQDAEVRQTQSGRLVASWGLAWNQPKKNQQGGYDDVPHYFDVSCWLSDRQAGYVVPLLVKGAPCAVVGGHLVFEQWEKDGQKRSKVSVMCDDPINGLVVGPKPAPAQQPPAQYGRQAQIAAYAPQQPAQAYAPQQYGQQAQAYAPQQPYCEETQQPYYEEDVPF